MFSSYAQKDEKFKQNFSDSLNPFCLIKGGIEDTELFCCATMLMIEAEVIFSTVSMRFCDPTD